LARRALDSGMRLTGADIVITQGCIEALNIALRAVAQPGDTIAVESPTYYGLLQVLESLGLRALEIPTSPRSGLSVDALELALRTHPGIKAVAVVPNFQNPLASVMPDDQKQRLVALCEQANVALIEDDTYGALSDDNATLSSLKTWDRSGNVIHCASLRKTLAPGMRVGWVSGGRWQPRIQMLKFAQSRANDALAQRTVGEFIASPAYDRHLVRLRRALRSQREQTAEAIAAHFPPGTRSSLPKGSMMLWVELPQQVSSQRLFDTALAHGIRIVPGLLFSNSDRYDHFMRIGCGFAFSREHDQALRRLGEMAARAAR
jgi:DNA-binding transcriptional MocR family regulator